jgi:hypothetical protein
MVIVSIEFKQANVLCFVKGSLWVFGQRSIALLAPRGKLGLTNKRCYIIMCEKKGEAAGF